MLLDLRIRNFAIIEGAELRFGAGLNVLSGETGAGKTIIMSALGLLVGGRASPELVRAEAKEAVVEGLFDLQGEDLTGEPADPEANGAGGELIIRRVIVEGGRSRVLVNDQLATVQRLETLGSRLVEVYGQHEQQTLLKPENHRRMLDRFGGLEPELVKYQELYARARHLAEQVEDLKRKERERADLLELARFRVSELERAALEAGEEERLGATRTLLANASRLAAAAAESQELLYGGDGAAAEAIARAEARIAEAAALDPALAPVLELIASARSHAEEAAHALRSYATRIESDPERLEQVDSRLQEIARLKRKYGGSVEAALETLENSRNEIVELEAAQENRAQAEQALEGALGALLDLGQKLSESRRRAAKELGRQMGAELRTLGMRNASFEVQFSGLTGEGAGIVRDGTVLGPSGPDRVEFLISPNLGQPPMALQRVASGGELSRVMLALKRLEAHRRGVATLIFDEVDAGIGGAVAQVVGRKLKELSRFHQVLCVTHLPQIAAFADNHFVVEKHERRGTTHSRVSTLEPAKRTEEIARMMAGGEITEKFRRAARELIEQARASG